MKANFDVVKLIKLVYKIINDINLADGKYNVEQGWNPIDNFTGTLDGQNHKLINLYISNQNTDIDDINNAINN